VASLFHLLFLGPLDGVVGLVAEDEFPFISVSSALFVRANALSTTWKLLVTLRLILVLTSPT
jgi:hypothetical protein